MKYFIHEFLNDLFSHDSKLFTTVKYLIFKPSFLVSEFISDRRIGYINGCTTKVPNPKTFFSPHSQESLKKKFLEVLFRGYRGKKGILSYTPCELNVLK